MCERACLCAAVNLSDKIVRMYVYSHLCLRECLWSCVQMCVFVRKILVFVFPQTGGVDLGSGLQGRPLPPQTQSLSDSESKRGRVLERRWRETGKDRRTRESDKEERQGIRKALEERRERTRSGGREMGRQGGKR